jgi:translation initiation factor 2B subunit (eIF-2B alpha/beta/delta family)
MLPTSNLVHYLDHVSAEIRDIVLELRNLIASIAPDAAEVRHSKGFSYFHEQRGGTVSAGICQIIIFDEAPWEYLKLMITESSNFNPRSITLNDSET